MKFDVMVFPTIPATMEEREELRPIGRNNERYQAMMDEVRDLAILCDEIGIDALSTTEHHFHSEGWEVSVAPLLLYSDLAARTKRLKFAPLGLVLPTWDPIRCAEELAILDHLSKGRVIAGFARGYQDRWLNAWVSTITSRARRWMGRRSIPTTVRSSKRCTRSSRWPGLRTPSSTTVTTTLFPSLMRKASAAGRLGIGPANTALPGSLTMKGSFEGSA